MKYTAHVEDRSYNIRLETKDEVIVDDECHLASLERTGAPSLYSLILDSSSHEVHVEEREGSYLVLLLGHLYTVQVEDERTRRTAKAGPKRPFEEGEIPIRSPIPGLIFNVAVTEGQRVQTGDILVIVEAMKMENELRAPRDGVVQATHVAPGDSVDKGQVLVTIA